MTTSPPTPPGVDFEVIRSELGTAVIGDVCDAFGRYHQCLPAAIAPLDDGMTLVGRAMPVLMGDCYQPPRQAFGLLTAALDQLEADEVYLTSGGLQRSAYWGEILSETAIARGAAGAVIDGYHRDTRRVLALGWPVFSRGRYAQDSGARSSVLAYRVPVEIDGVAIPPGALVVGDIDGVVVVPPDIEADVIDAALRKAATESQVLTAIRAGMSSTQAWHEFGVL